VGVGPGLNPGVVVDEAAGVGDSIRGVLVAEGGMGVTGK